MLKGEDLDECMLTKLVTYLLTKRVKSNVPNNSEQRAWLMNVCVGSDNLLSLSTPIGFYYVPMYHTKPFFIIKIRLNQI